MLCKSNFQRNVQFLERKKYKNNQMAKEIENKLDGYSLSSANYNM